MDGTHATYDSGRGWLYRFTTLVLPICQLCPLGVFVPLFPFSMILSMGHFPAYLVLKGSEDAY
jgi:hypothetical protein